MALAEAGAAGLPLVSTPVGAIPELVRPGTTGELVRPDDSAELAMVLRRLAEDAGYRRALGAGAASLVRADHDARRNAHAVVDVLVDAIKERRWTRAPSSPSLAERVASGESPRPDYTVLAERLDADIIDLAEARRSSGRPGRLIERLGGAGAVIAWTCFRRRDHHPLIITDGEQVGIPFAALCRFFGRRRSRHMMIVHVLSVPKKMRLMRLLWLAPLIDRFVVYSSAQRTHLVTALHVPADRIVRSTFMVDAEFFSEGRAPNHRRRMICAAGLERRDYQTLIQAVDGLDVEVVIGAASPWSKWPDSSKGGAVPANVEIRQLGFQDLRQLYADCAFVVMPLEDVDFQAGITTILEAMSMQRTIVCTRTAGQTDTIVDGRTGVYVAPRDSAGLRAAITCLLEDPARADQLGRCARHWVERHATVEVYADRLALIARQIPTA
jgi:glycosyltransferase involved in cell wall biosynthesis